MRILLFSTFVLFFVFFILPWLMFGPCAWEKGGCVEIMEQQVAIQNRIGQ